MFHLATSVYAEDQAQWEVEWELWSGFPVALKPSPGLEHQLVSGALAGELRRALEKAGCRVRRDPARSSVVPPVTTLHDLAKTCYTTRMDRCPVPSDFSTYQAYLDNHHARRAESRDRLQAALSMELSSAGVEEMLALAGRFGHVSEFEQLVSRYVDTIQPNKRLGDAGSPFFLACELDSTAAIALLYAHGADLESRDALGRTPLGVTPYYTRAHWWLLEHGANPDSNGACHPLWKATLDGDLAAVTKYVRAGASVDLADESGRTPLWTACNRRRTACVQFLLQAGANPNWADHDGRVPLMLKISLRIARMLIEHGADPTLVDAQGRSVLDIQAHRAEFCQLIRSLVSPGEAV